MGVKQFGRYKRKPKNQRYWAENHRLRNKLKRITRSEGNEAARRYTARHRLSR
jgi:hypothetical protein